MPGGKRHSTLTRDFQSELFLIVIVSETGDVPKHQDVAGWLSDLQKWWNDKACLDCQKTHRRTRWRWLSVVCCRRSASSTWRLPSWGSVVTIPPSHISLNPSTSQTSGSALTRSREWSTTEATPGTGEKKKDFIWLFMFNLKPFKYLNNTQQSDTCFTLIFTQTRRYRSALAVYFPEWFRSCNQHY